MRTVEGQPEEPPDEGLLEERGISKKDELIHAMISWTTLESYPLRIGVSLPIVNPMMVDGEEALHEGQLWEETEEQWIVEEKHAEFVYEWLSNRFKARSPTKMLPMGMPESVEEMAVQTSRDGSYGYILFAPEDSLAEAMKKMEVQVIGRGVHNQNVGRRILVLDTSNLGIRPNSPNQKESRWRDRPWNHVGMGRTPCPYPERQEDQASPEDN
jgi:hypothetical protein